MKNKPENPHSGHRQRIRQKFITNSFEGFADHEILELLLFYSNPRRDTNELAHKMIKEFGTFHTLLEANPKEIMNRCGVSETTAVLVSMIIPMYRRYASGKWEKRIQLDTSSKAGNFAISLFAGEPMECFYLICLDNQRRLIYPELISRGTINEAQIYPRTIVKTALKHNSASVILCHNHPAGLLAASQSDIAATKSIISALEPIHIDVIDHIIVAGEAYLSFSEKRLLSMAYD